MNGLIMSEQFQLKIPSNLEEIAKVENMLESLKVQYAISDELYANILLAAVEAVTNAIEHGNNLDIQKFVSIELVKTEATIQLKISDEGGGFNPYTLADPTSEEFLEKPGGRGVFLIQQLADEVLFKKDGSAVEMVFILP